VGGSVLLLCACAAAFWCAARSQRQRQQAETDRSMAQVRAGLANLSERNGYPRTVPASMSSATQSGPAAGRGHPLLLGTPPTVLGTDPLLGARPPLDGVPVARPVNDPQTVLLGATTNAATTTSTVVKPPTSEQHI
jgi:hypothetical protein